MMQRICSKELVRKEKNRCLCEKANNKKINGKIKKVITKKTR